MVLTLSAARKLYGNLAGAGNSFTDRINELSARLLPEVDAKGTTVAMRFAVYQDSRGNHIITTPNDIENILAGAYEPLCGGTGPTGPTGPFWWGGQPLPVRNGWYEYSESGPGLMIGTNRHSGIVRLQGRFCTFSDWNTPMQMRVVPEIDESPGGTIIFRGRLNNEKWFSQQGSDYLEGFGLVYTTTAPVTSTQTVDEPPYQIIKPRTKGRLRLYAVDTNNNQTLVGDYGPNETGPSYIRYKVPTPTTTT